MKLIKYDEDEFPLRAVVTELVGVDDLSELINDMPLVTRERDQSTSYHSAFYWAFENMRDLYERFVHHVAAEHVEAPYCFQGVPTFRVQLPDNLAVGEFHKDADYNHPDGEVNFWVPLTPVEDTSAVWIEFDDRYVPVPVQPGEVLMFDAVNTRHGNVVNRSGRSRVSFDFRCLPMRRHRDTEAASLNTNLRFVVGGYYLTNDQSLELPQ